MDKKQTLIATTFQGLEGVLAKELEDLGARKVETLRRAVSFVGNKKLLYKANLHLRTAIRVLVPIHSFFAKEKKALYDGASKIPWEEYLNSYKTFSIDPVVNSPFFTHSHYAALVTKDAIVDRLREKKGERPSVDPKNPDVRINLLIQKDKVSISLDSSGESLHKRGYRLAQNKAPLSEVLASGMLALSGWDGRSNFVDPMCGSGTILIEAAMRALNIAAGSRRQSFGFMNWRGFDKRLWRDLRAEALAKERKHTKIELLGGDIDPEAIRITQANLKRCGIEDHVRLEHSAFDLLEPPKEGGLLLMNPPYGERLKPDEILPLYKSMGDTLKQKYEGYTAWILSSNVEALKHIGLKASKRMELFNGPLLCKFHQYEMYAGSEVVAPS